MPSIYKFISPYSSRIASIGGIFNLPSALHQWSYQNSEIVGTTMTATDFGSVGGLNMTNPTAISLPTLTNNEWGFDGLTQFLENANSFRNTDTTGVFHAVIKVESKNNSIFCCADETSDLEFLGGRTMSTDKARLQRTFAIGTNQLETTATYSGYIAISFVQDGTQAYLVINGSKVIAYDSATLTTEWLDAGFDNICIGTIKRLSPVYYDQKQKYLGYSAYSSEANAIADNLKMYNAIQNGF